MNPLTNKFNYMPGGVYGANGGAYGNSYGGGIYGNNRPSDFYGNNRPYDGQVNGPYPGQGGLMMPGGFGGDFEGKSSLILPLAGAALLGKFENFKNNIVFFVYAPLVDRNHN